MTDDLLKRASAALRDETADADEGARFTRARVLASLQQSQVRRRSRLALLMPLAACFAAASAFGMVTGKMPALVRSVSNTLGFSEAPAPVPRKRTATPTAARTPAPVTDPAPTTEPVPATEPAPAPATDPASRATPLENPAPAEGATPSAAPAAVPAEARRSAPQPERAPGLKGRVAPLSASPTPAVKDEAPFNTPPTAPAPAEPSDVSDRAHELYRVAHRSHFVEHDFVSALRAWDAYLRDAPNGRFALEARYNRALCLVRLGRSAEAREALTPFANAKVGSYRQAEASALIDAINH